MMRYLLLLMLAGCSSETVARGDGLDPSKVPSELRAEYDLFAIKCSKCHSLQRPLQSGIDNDEYWREYVLRMRRQPGSGISPQDGEVIMRFLRYYAAEQRKRKGGT